MRVTRLFALAILLAPCSLAMLRAAYGQLVLGVSVNEAPPPLPIYDQPPIPAPGYLWVPGYWAWSEGGGYYWVPGTWIMPPKAGLVWTPGYWGSEEGV
jgi:WXXGXW repeat (2 copies)